MYIFAGVCYLSRLVRAGVAARGLGSQVHFVSPFVPPPCLPIPFPLVVPFLSPPVMPTVLRRDRAGELGGFRSCRPAPRLSIIEIGRNHVEHYLLFICRARNYTSVQDQYNCSQLCTIVHKCGYLQGSRAGIDCVELCTILCNCAQLCIIGESTRVLF